jgi:hypothetical protein
MNALGKILTFVDSNFTQCLPWIILSLILTQKIFKPKSLPLTIKIVRYYILGYTVFSIFNFLVIKNGLTESQYFINSAKPPYYIIHIFFLFTSLILPFSLFITKIKSKLWYLFFVSIAIKAGIYFERFIIITTSLHRDYLNEGFLSEELKVFTLGVFLQMLQGAIIAAFLLGILNFVLRTKKSTY